VNGGFIALVSLDGGAVLDGVHGNAAADRLRDQVSLSHSMCLVSKYWTERKKRGMGEEEASFLVLLVLDARHLPPLHSITLSSISARCRASDTPGFPLLSPTAWRHGSRAWRR